MNALVLLNSSPISLGLSGYVKDGKGRMKVVKKDKKYD
jgi:hypothetical protein